MGTYLGLVVHPHDTPIPIDSLLFDHDHHFDYYSYVTMSAAENLAGAAMIGRPVLFAAPEPTLDWPQPAIPARLLFESGWLDQHPPDIIVNRYGEWWQGEDVPRELAAIHDELVTVILFHL